MTALEHVVRAFARRMSHDGRVALITDGHPALVAAFAELGWSDPYPDPLLLPPVLKTPEPTIRMATVKAVESAVLPRPKGYAGG